MDRARHRFRERLDRIPFEANLVYGPGKNIDKHPSELSMDWTLSVDESKFLPSRFRGSSIKRLYRKVRKLANHVPILSLYDSRRASHRTSQVLDDFSYTMKCTAVPKSYKAYRGVGVMSAHV